MIGMTTMRNQYTEKDCMMIKVNQITCPYCTLGLDIETLSDGKQFLVDRYHFDSTCPTLFDYVKDDGQTLDEPDPDYGWVTEWEDK